MFRIIKTSNEFLEVVNGDVTYAIWHCKTDKECEEAYEQAKDFKYLMEHDI